MSMIVIPRPAVAGPGPSQAATAVGAGGVGGGTETVMRITAWDCEVADEGSSKLTFTLALPPPGKAPTPPTLYFPQLIAQLQQQSTNNASTIPSIPTGGGGPTADITTITSLDGTVHITFPAGPAVDLSVPDVDIGGGTLIGQTVSPSLASTALGFHAMGLAAVGATIATGSSATVIGAGACPSSTVGANNTAVGAQALNVGSGGFSNTAVGASSGQNTGSEFQQVFLGANTSSPCTNTVVVGQGATVGTYGASAIAIGAGSQANNNVHGAEAGITPYNQIAIGYQAHAWFDNDIAIGYNTYCDDTVFNFGESVVIGYQALTGSYWCIAIGDGAQVGSGTYPGSIAIGYHVQVNAEESIAIGYAATCPVSAATNAIAIGSGANAGVSGTPAHGYAAIAIGQGALAYSDRSMAVGAAAQVTSAGAGQYGSAVGANAQVTADYATAIGGAASGNQPQAALPYSVSIGTTYSQVAIGPCTTTQFPSGLSGACLFLPNATGSPGTPSFGGSLYVAAGALHWIGSAGTNTTIAPA